MKLINPTLKNSLKFLTFLVTAFLSTQLIQAAAPGVLPKGPSYFNPSPDIACAESWQNLQVQMTTLSPSSAPEFLLIAEGSIIDYRSALAQREIKSYNSEFALAAGMDLLNIDTSNPLSSVQCSVDLAEFEGALLHARSTDQHACFKPNNFYAENDTLIQDVEDGFLMFLNDLFNVDASNPDAVDQVKAEMNDCKKAVKKLQKKIRAYEKSELQDAVNAIALTEDEQQLWNQFQSTLNEKCNAACARYLANPTFAAFSYITTELLNLDPTNPVALLDLKFEEQEAIDANINTFKLLKQACLYEFLNVLLTKRSDTDSSLNSFHQLQDRLNQFLNNVDLNNPIAALQAQVDMLAYEKEISELTTPVTTATLVK